MYANVRRAVDRSVVRPRDRKLYFHSASLNGLFVARDGRCDTMRRDANLHRGVHTAVFCARFIRKPLL